MATAANSKGKRVWDPLVRLTHWLIALTIVVNGIFLRDGTLVHVWIGYAALGALLLRLAWGLVAPGPARFSAMTLAPSRAFAHLRDLAAGRWRDGPGHTPLGAWMALSIWLLLGVTAATGLLLHADPFPGDETRLGWAEYLTDRETEDEGFETEDDESEAFGEFIEELHEAAATGLLILAALHVAGVGLESRLAGVNLAKGMIRNSPERPRQ